MAKVAEDFPEHLVWVALQTGKAIPCAPKPRIRLAGKVYECRGGKWLGRGFNPLDAYKAWAGLKR